MAIVENFEALMNLYEFINAKKLVGKKVEESELKELRMLASECNKKTKSFNLNVEGSDASLMKSIKSLVEKI